jgi:formylmethanofuran dehydrogenase subunit A
VILIRGAEVYDPAQGISGQVKDVWIDGERIGLPSPGSLPLETIDATGMVLAPAAVEIHTHVAGSPLNSARRFLAGNPALLDLLAPPAETAARRYLSLGYTTVFDAASSPLLARLTAVDLERMRGIDRGSFTQLGDHRLLLGALSRGDLSEIRDTLAWLLQISGGYAVKLVNPGGATAWKAGLAAPSLDDTFGFGSLTQRRIIQILLAVVNEIGLPHPLHLHAGRLGIPGNASSFCETVRALEGQRAHLCHIQFYSYGADNLGGYTSAAAQVLDCLAQYPQITCDVGQVVFGAAMALSSDTSGLYSLQESIGCPWISRQLEGEGGTNILPLDYAIKDPTSAIQWAAGLELLLGSPDPTRLLLTTDHPNGAPFSAYPQVIEWLMSKPARQEFLKRCHPAATHKTGLAGFEREYTLEEVFALTSWGPAKALGLSDRGHLGTGALADLRCYRKQADIRAMFNQPAWVMRRGRVVCKEGQFLQHGEGNILVVRPPWDEGRRSRIESSLEGLVSIPADQYALGKSRIRSAQEVACTSTMS